MGSSDNDPVQDGLGFLFHCLQPFFFFFLFEVVVMRRMMNAAEARAAISYPLAVLRVLYLLFNLIIIITLLSLPWYLSFTGNESMSG